MVASRTVSLRMERAEQNPKSYDERLRVTGCSGGIIKFPKAFTNLPLHTRQAVLCPTWPVVVRVYFGVWPAFRIAVAAANIFCADCAGISFSPCSQCWMYPRQHAEPSNPRASRQINAVLSASTSRRLLGVDSSSTTVDCSAV